SSTSCPFFPTSTNAYGTVWICASQVPHAEPEQRPSQSKQSGSCSAPIVMVPPSGTFPEKTVVGLDFEPACGLLLEPHAASTIDNVINVASTLMRMREPFTGPPRTPVVGRCTRQRHTATGGTLRRHRQKVVSIQ